MARVIERVKVADIYPLEDEYGNQYLSRDYDLEVNKDYVRRLAESFGPDGEPDEEVKLIRDGDVFRIKAGNSRVRAMQLLGTEECWAVIDDDDTVKGVLETVVRTNVKKKYEPLEESKFVQQLAMFGDDEYVGEISSLGTETASRLRRGRKVAGDKAQQMTLDHLSAVADFEGYPEWAEELASCDEDSWRYTASRLQRAMEEREQVEAFQRKAAECRITLVEDRPDELRYVVNCDSPEAMEGAYMQAAAEHRGIVGRLCKSWNGVTVDFYGVPLHEDEEEAAEAERRRLRDEYAAKGKAVDEALWNWAVDRFDEVYEGELPGDFRVLAQHCFEVAINQYWVSHVLNTFKGIPVEEDCVFLFLTGYNAARKTFHNSVQALAQKDPSKSPFAGNLKEALKWAEMHEQDGWEPDEGMAEFLAEAREKIGAKEVR